MSLKNRLVVHYIRKTSIFVLAAFVSLGLLLVMNKLIQIPQPKSEKKLPEIKKIDRIANKKPIVQTFTVYENTGVQEQPKVIPIALTPISPIIDELENALHKPNVTQDSVSVVPTNKPIRTNAVTPVYPTKALKKNLCGWAVVQYSVTDSGIVSNAVLVDSSHKVFGYSAIQAVLKYKHKPAISGGKAVEVIGLKTKVAYELEGGCS